MARSFPRSALKSSQSPSRSWLSVSFEDDLDLDLHLQNHKSGGTPARKTRAQEKDRSSYFRIPPVSSEDSFTSRDKRDFSRELHASFTSEDGISLEELACDEIDDILPKTDYTYARTGSYSQKYINKKRCISPNMSRRKVHSSQPAFLSDDEDDFDEDMNNDIISSVSNQYQHRDYTSFDQESLGSESQRSGRSRSSNFVASTPMYPHGEHHISAHDHYYEGMELRSGSHIKGSRTFGYNRRSARLSGDSKASEIDTTFAYKSRRSDGDALLSKAAYRSDMEMSQRRSGRNFTKVTETTTTVTSTNNDEENHKGGLEMDDMTERKLRLDESQTEKGHKLQHLYGLDSDDEISDVDDFDVPDSRKAALEISQSDQNRSFFWFITTIVTTIVTTVTTTFSDDNGSVLKSAAVTLSKPVVVPTRWLLKGVRNIINWMATRSATFLLWEIEAKQRRRRGCCCCLLPLLFLLPLFLLGAHYSRDMQESMGTYGNTMGHYLADSKDSLASYWSYLWVSSSSDKEVPVYQPPVPPAVAPPIVAPPVTPAAEVNQIDMTEIYQYIQQTVIQASASNKDERPVGLTREEVEAIVRAIMAGEMNDVKSGMDGKVDTLQGLLQGGVEALEKKISDLQAEIKLTADAHKTMVGNIEQVKASFESTSTTNDQAADWARISANLEQKLLDLTSEVNQLSSQNAALTAMMTNCCRNNTVLADTVRAQVLAVLSEMGSDDENSLAGLMAWMNGRYVNRAEFDQRLSAVSTEIMEKLRVLMAKMEEKSTADTQVETTVVSGIDELAVKSIVEEALTQFSADRVGLPDFALESAGGSVLSVRCSETYYRKTALVSIFGIPLWYSSNSPRTVIQPNVHPGECWAFKGKSGYLVLQLSHPIQPTAFTLEHIPKSLAPKGEIRSAPKDFTVFGLLSERDTQGINLGNYTYSQDGPPIQYFPIQNGHPSVFQHVELRILDNHGNEEYTCLYRFRVHGLL